LNVRGTSNPTTALAGPAVVGSQSYNYPFPPIIDLPGRAGLDLVLTPYYNSRIWDVDTVNNTVTFNADRDFPSYGFRLDFGYVEYAPGVPVTKSQFIVTEGDGSKHSLKYGGTIYNSADGTFLSYNKTTNVLTYKNGRTIQYVPFPSNPQLFRPVTIEDTHGNYISITYVSGQDQLISTITDTLGRVITFKYDGSNRLSSITQALQSSGTMTLATFTWTTLYGNGYAWYNFSGLFVNAVPDLSTPLNVLASCTYANGTAYRLSYGDWGIINKIENLAASSPVITIPSTSNTVRSSISYNYAAATSPQSDAPTYTQQTISPDGGTANLSTWTYAATKSGTGAVTSMIITDPNGNTSTTNLDPSTGLTSSVQLKDSSGALLRTVTYTWTTSGGASVPLSITTKLEDTGQQSSVQYAYDSYGNPTTVSEYDFGGVLKRQTVTTYATGAYVTQHILNLPTQVLVKDAAGNVAGRTDLAYDSTSPGLTPVTGAANHDDANFGAGFTTRGDLTSVTRYADAATPAGGVTRNFNYDTLGNLLVAQLSCCNQKVFNFSSATQWSQPDSIVRGPTSGPQFTTSYAYNFDTSLMASSTDENNQATNYSYDSMNRTTQVLLPPQGPTHVQLKTAFDDTAASPTVTKSNTANSAVNVTTLDGLGHVLRVDNKNGSTVVSSVTSGYDKLWQRTQTSNPFAPGDTVVNTSFSYDGLGRVTQMTPPSAGSAQYSYSGNAVTMTDPAGKQRKKVTDALGRLVEVDEPGDSFAGAAASGGLIIGGAVQSKLPPASLTVNIVGGGYTIHHIVCTTDRFGIEHCHTNLTPGSGVVQFSVNAGGTTVGPVSVNYDGNSTAASLAAALFNAFPANPVVSMGNPNGSSSFTLTTFATGSSANNTTFTGTATQSPACAPTDDTWCTGSGWGTDPTQANFSGGADTPVATDAGTVTLSIPSPTGTYTATANYGNGASQDPTAAAVASDLVGQIQAQLPPSNPPFSINVPPNGTTISINWLSVGASGNVNVTTTSTTTQTAYFSQPSFASCLIAANPQPCSTSLTGGKDPYSSGVAHPFVTSYTYDVMGNLTGVSVAAGTVNGQQQVGQPRGYTYDGLSRLLTATTPESGAVTNSYTNSDGTTCAGDPSLPCRVTDARGIVKTLTYDGINRPSTVTYSDGSTPGVTYIYDVGGAAAFANGRPTKITEGSNSQTLTYDNFGRITNVSQVIDSATYNIQYAYNLASQLSSITYPSNRVVTQNYDTIGRTSSVADSAATYLNSLSYNAAGETLGLTMGNGVQGTFTYNDHAQLSTLRYFKSGAASDVLNLAYDYTTASVAGNNGQIQAVHYFTSPGVEDLTKSENFTYDSWGRLSAAKTSTVSSNATDPPTWSLQWGYDRLGNRVSQKLVGGNVSIGQPNFMMDPGTNRIVGYCYDAAGNLLDEGTCPTGTHQYSYDGANRLTAINGGPPWYTYFGPLRIKKVAGSTTTTYIYSGSKPIAEYVGSSNPTLSKEYIYAGSQLLATISGSSTTYHHPDHLSNRAETDQSGASMRTFGHFPFGETWYETGTADKLKFTSYENDSGTGETGLSYAQFRYHSPGQGRFMSADLMDGSPGAPQSLNRYSYALNDPVNLVDPLGLYAFWEICQPVLIQSATWKSDGVTINTYGLMCFPVGVASRDSSVGKKGGRGKAGALNGFPINLSQGLAGAPQPGPFVERILLLQLIIDMILSGNNPCADFFNSSALVGPFGASEVYDNLHIQIQDNSAGAYTSTAAISSQGSAFQAGNDITLWTNSPFGKPMQPANYGSPGPPAPLHLGSFLGGSIGGDVLIMLHELAHILGVIPPDGRAADPTGQQTKTNEKTIEDNCDDAVRAAGASPGPGL
jgi:RHS repeat-associated protein